MNNNNWDVIHAASAESLNALLKLNFFSIAFTDTAEVKYSKDISFNIEVQFKELQIVSGGADKYVVLDLKTDGNINNGEFEYTDLVSRVRIDLEFFSENPAMGQIRLSCSADTIQFILMDVNKIFPQEQAATLSVLNKVYTDMMVKHADKLEYAFASIMGINNPLIGMKQFDYSWYQPASNECTGFLAILGVMDDRDISKYPRLVDSNLLFGSDAEQYDCVYLAAKERFLKYSMIPSLCSIFPQAKQSDFEFSDGSIKNTGNINLQEFAVGVNWYQPYIDSFDFHIDSDKLVTNFSGRCPITDLPDSYVDFTLSAKNGVKYESSLNSIKFIPDSNMTVTANKDIPSYVKWLDIITLGTLNLIIDGVSGAAENCIKEQLKSYNVSSASLGAEAVGWASNVIMNEGGISDNLYLRGKRIFK